MRWGLTVLALSALLITSCGLQDLSAPPVHKVEATAAPGVLRKQNPVNTTTEIPSVEVDKPLPQVQGNHTTTPTVSHPTNLTNPQSVSNSPSAPAKPAVHRTSPSTDSHTLSAKSLENEWTHLPKEVNTGKYVVLTFDDGPSPWTGALIKILNRAHVPAVLFWNTYHLSFANSEVCTLLDASPGITVGNHTVDHPNLLKLGETGQYHEIVDASKAIEQKTKKPVLLFRPPYGNYNLTTISVVHRAGLYPVLWDDDSLDWKYGDNETAILKQIQSHLHPGSVILLHDHQYTVKFLPDILAMLKAEGYGFTTFSAVGNQN